ncbi:nitrate/nitrite transporter NarK [Mumia flava]|uniref:Nitrate/nitrite transporter NarK n=1 Tax=Mumia flava TaxID=1348852 RepID=A0A2M9AQ63_9ACTN|nr:MFS transporter [Mumia flava]PJJ47841.1 nitrate/nitrite transporter NarK [Mumia flava]
MIATAARRLGLRRSATAVWLVALLVYVLAVFHRSSLAVAGLAATDRFDITAAQLSAFTVLQLVVYAGMQIPVGLALDRWGPRAVIFAGVVTLSVAQTVFALADSYPLAVGARIAVGAGDAMVFVCVLRLVNTWFEPRRIPLMTQLTGISGQAGTIVAAAPMTWALHTLGWTTSYLVTAAVGLVLAAALLAVVHDRPGARNVRGPELELRGIGSRIRTAWSDPGTQLGFWTHFSTQFSGTMLALLWGFPFFVRGEHTSPAFASALLTILILATMAAGPVIAWRTSTRPERRTRLVLGIVMAIVAVWSAVLAWPGDAPSWLLVLLVVVVAVGGPGSLVGFDFVRTYGVPERLGLATAVVNMGGFIASLSTVLAIGVVLDLLTSGGSQAYPTDAFRWAMAVQAVPWLIGAVQIWRHQRKLDRLPPASSRPRRNELQRVPAS